MLLELTTITVLMSGMNHIVKYWVGFGALYGGTVLGIKKFRRIVNDSYLDDLNEDLGILNKIIQVTNHVAWGAGVGSLVAITTQSIPLYIYYSIY